MLTPIMRRIAAGAQALARSFSATAARSRRRRATGALSHWNERLLRDVGLTRADYLACLSSPWDSPDEFRHLHLVGDLCPVIRQEREIDKLAA